MGITRYLKCVECGYKCGGGNWCLKCECGPRKFECWSCGQKIVATIANDYIGIECVDCGDYAIPTPPAKKRTTRNRKK